MNNPIHMYSFFVFFFAKALFCKDFISKLIFHTGKISAYYKKTSFFDFLISIFEAIISVIKFHLVVQYPVI